MTSGGCIRFNILVLRSSLSFCMVLSVQCRSMCCRFASSAPHNSQLGCGILPILCSWWGVYGIAFRIVVNCLWLWV